MTSVNVRCPRCQSAQVYRHGQNPKGRDRFHCRDCHCMFLLTYTYEARKPRVKEKITEMAFNCAGDRDRARTLKIGSKASQHWFWYAYNTKTGGILAYTFGPRTDETSRELLALLTPFNIVMITSDDWGSYSREVPKDKNLTGKTFTQRIERNNLTQRTSIKRLAHKTICFSRSFELHVKIIGAFIEKYMFY